MVLSWCHKHTCSPPAVLAGTRWTSGALFDDALLLAQQEAEAARLRALKDDPELPLVWLDVSVKGKAVGRMYAVLFVKEAPRSAENFRQLITGVRGTGEGWGWCHAVGGGERLTHGAPLLLACLPEVCKACGGAACHACVVASCCGRN